MSALELCAVALGVANVALIIRRSVWNYPFGLAMVALYGLIFVEARLYSEAALQVFFFVVQLVGWRQWLRHRDAAGLVAPLTLGTGGRVAAVVATVAAAAAIGTGMAYTDAAAPYWDATVAALSVTAQVLLTLRRIENWLFWIATDVVAIGLYLDRGLTLTAGLYALFLVMACAGLLAWVRALRR